MSKEGTSKGDDIYKKAEGKVDAWIFKDFDEGYELFCKAAAAYKVEQNFNKAGEAFMRAGDCAMKQKDSPGACQAYTESAQCYKKVDLKKASAAISVAIQLNIENNRLSAAAKLEKDYAESLENDCIPEEALVHYKKAHDYYFAEDQPQAATSCLTKMAKIYGETDNFTAAIPIYEQIGTQAANGPLKHQAREFFVRALLCRCALINEGNRTEKSAETIEAFENYLVTDINLKHTREQEFCELLLQAVEENDVERLDEATALLDEMRLLDTWKTHILLVIKKGFECIR